MRKLILSCLLLASWNSGLFAASILIDGVVAPVTVGQQFDVTINIIEVFGGLNPSDELVGFGFDLSIGNPSIVQLAGFSVLSPFFDAAFPGTDVAGFAFPGVAPGVSEPVSLATLTFLALSPGSTTLGVTSDLNDPNQGLFYLSSVAGLSGRVLVSVSAVPEPSSWLLLAGGLAACILLRRRQ